MDQPQSSPILEGEVIYADTGNPVPKARLTIGVSEEAPNDASFYDTDANADEMGRFRITAPSAKFFYLSVYPQDEPYLIVDKQIELASITLPSRMAIALPRGVLVRGKIVDADSGEPVSGAVIQYDENSENAYAPERVMPGWVPHNVEVESDGGGAFRIVVPPGRGTLLVQGPENRYIRQTIENRQLDEGVTKRIRLYVCALVPLDLTLENEPADLHIAIRLGVTVRGQIVGPEDRSVDEVVMLSRLFISPYHTNFLLGCVTTAKGGTFELHGLDPEEAVPVYFLDPKNELGAVVEISGESGANEPLVVRLCPCGKAVVRFVDPAGKPQARAEYQPGLHIVVTPGPFRGDDKRAKEELCSDQDFVANFDREHYLRGSETNGEGRCTFPALIAGATYRILTFRGPGEWDEKDFTVKSGETLQLGDIVLTP